MLNNAMAAHTAWTARLKAACQPQPRCAGQYHPDGQPVPIRQVALRSRDFGRRDADRELPPDQTASRQVPRGSFQGGANGDRRPARSGRGGDGPASEYTKIPSALTNVLTRLEHCRLKRNGELCRIL